MDQDVGTTKPRFSITVEPHIHEALEAYCEQNFVSKSEVIEHFLSIFFSLPLQKREKLEKLAQGECRGLTDQIQFLILTALADHPQ